jgi:hypothetical protein
VAIDDVQWLDAASHEAIAFIARRVGRDPVAVVAVARSGHPGPILHAGLPELAVPPLDDVAARSLLDEHGAALSYGAQERVLRYALGNPLALVERPRTAERGARSIDDALPLSTRLVRAFSARIEELPAPTRDVLLIAAVDSADDVPEILRAAGVLHRQPVTLDALEPATVAGIVSFDEMRVSFRHPLVRSGVLNTESTARRQAAHAALARVLDGDDYRRVWHRAHAIDGPSDDVADELERTHRTAIARGSPVGAIWALERAAQLTTDLDRRARLLLLAAEQAFGLGRADLVDRLLVAAEQAPLDDLDRVRMEWIREIFNDGVPGDAGRVFELCTIARLARDAGDGDLALNLLLAAALRCWWADTGPTARAEVARAARDFEHLLEDPRWVAALAVADPVLAAAVVV